ncbi:hypothetical protein O7607_22620 [Micromonospora sp. WMMA1949]|uniref:hypothetical protein n=1 Tax=unclassified Micromonospora TaxID=2617518 RepID=UPI0022B6896B|nr:MULTISPECIES: hypothetical protein [unclassified Micromonospora]MCZ7428543.1 hypothetical protein [Micromonospora sp. WMMA1949]WBC07426.1 hypothetical protein O7604_19600 [Micromonospora sp. WMMA1947]
MTAGRVTTVLFDFTWTPFARESERWVGNAEASIDQTLTAGEAHRIVGDFAGSGDPHRAGTDSWG